MPNPFDSNSAAHVPVASGSAGATPCPQPRAPAALIEVSDGRRQSLADGTPELEAGLTCGSTLGLPDSSGTAVALPRTSVPDAQTDAAADTFDEEYRCPGGQIVDAAGCELCGPISNADCPYWPDEIQSSDGELPDSPIDSHGLTDADCKWPLSLLEGETTRQIIKPSETEAAAVVHAAASDKISEPSMTNGGDPGAPASAPTKNPDVGALGTDCIGEIFHYARKLSAEARWFVPDYPDIYQAMLDPNAPRALETDPVWADDPPLFLQRREA